MSNATAQWVVGSDGSKGAERALDWCVANARGRATTVHVVQAWHYPTVVGAAVMPVPDIDVVVGERGHRGLKAALLGSTAIEVLHRAEMTTVIVPATQRRAFVPCQAGRRSGSMMAWTQPLDPSGVRKEQS